MDTVLELVTLATGIVVLVTAILALLNKRRIDQVHVLVNSQMTTVVTRVEQLVAALEASDVDVPPSPPTPTPQA